MNNARGKYIGLPILLFILKGLCYGQYRYYPNWYKRNYYFPLKTQNRMWAYGHFDVNKAMIVFSIINYTPTYVITYLEPGKIPFLLGVCLGGYVLFCHFIMCLSHAVHGFWPIYIVGLFTSVQPEVVGMSLFNNVFVTCFSMDLWPTYGFGISVFVQPEVVGRFVAL